MNEQNIQPQPGANKNVDQSKAKNTKNTGLDNWNDRLDNNLEPEAEADVQADENAEDFQESADDDAKRQ